MEEVSLVCGSMELYKELLFEEWAIFSLDLYLCYETQSEPQLTLPE